MSLNPRNLAKLSTGAGTAPSLWSYESTADDIAAILTDDYFGGAPCRMEAGDFVFVAASDGPAVIQITAIDCRAQTNSATNVCECVAAP